MERKGKEGGKKRKKERSGIVLSRRSGANGGIVSLSDYRLSDDVESFPGVQEHLSLDHLTITVRRTSASTFQALFNGEKIRT